MRVVCTEMPDVCGALSQCNDYISMNTLMLTATSRCFTWDEPVCVWDFINSEFPEEASSAALCLILPGRSGVGQSSHTSTKTHSH